MQINSLPVSRKPFSFSLIQFAPALSFMNVTRDANPRYLWTVRGSRPPKLDRCLDSKKESISGFYFLRSIVLCDYFHLYWSKFGHIFSWNDCAAKRHNYSFSYQCLSMNCFLFSFSESLKIISLMEMYYQCA